MFQFLLGFSKVPVFLCHPVLVMSKYRMYAARLTRLLKTPLGIQMLRPTCLHMVPLQLGTLVTGHVQQVQINLDELERQHYGTTWR